MTRLSPPAQEAASSPLSGAASSRETRRLHFVWSLGGAVLLFGLLYRVRLYYNLYTAHPPYRAFRPQHHSFASLLQQLWTEWAWALQVAALGWLLWSLGALLLARFRPARRVIPPLGWLALHVFLFACAFLYGSHLRAMFDVQSGLTYDLWSEGLDAFGPADILRFLSATDVFFLLLPIGLFWALWRLPVDWRPWRNRVLLGGSALILLLAALPLSSRATWPDRAVRMTPIQHLASDYLRMLHALQRPDGLGPATPPKGHRRRPPSPRTQAPVAWKGRKPSETVRLIHPLMIQPVPAAPRIALRPTPPTATTPLFPPPRRPLFRQASAAVPTARPPHRPQPAAAPNDKRPWNVLFYMLESVGTRYIFDRRRAGRMPMRFLHKIAQRGWYFTNHYASANSSPRAIFSMLTGLYPSPQIDMFEMRREICAPSLYTFLNPTHDTFFMTPGSLRWYFPRDFFLNNGPHDLYGARSFRRFKRYGSFPNEIDVTTALIRRIKRAKKPFLASYLSFIPHGPYDDYGPKYRLLSNTKRDINRYYNNLYVLDLQIKRLFRALHRAGLLQHTIVVFVGDHGQAFGQHRRNWGHSRKSYNENYHAPMIFYQPKLFAPRVIRRRTSHVDILPTLLDILKVPYEPLLFQGESLRKTRLQRKQIFMYGNESTLSLLDRANIKMQYLRKRRRCWVYDLNQDPNERRRLRCQDYPTQQKTLRLYMTLQRKLRRLYDRSCQRKKPFFGLQHPPPKAR